MARVEVTIELDDDDAVDGDGFHVVGTVRHPEGPEIPFVGWIGLLGLLQQAVSRPAEQRSA